MDEDDDMEVEINNKNRPNEVQILAENHDDINPENMDDVYETAEEEHARIVREQQLAQNQENYATDEEDDENVCLCSQYTQYKQSTNYVLV